MESRNRALLLALLLLSTAAGAVLIAEAPHRQRQERSAEFQRLVGGLGFGPALDLSGCAFGLDPRLDDSCSEQYGPIPGGRCFCPRHAGTVFSYPERQADRSQQRGGAGDVSSR
jgi:hypothetical protein